MMLDTYYRRFAWLPTQLTNNKILWLKPYYKAYIDMGIGFSRLGIVKYSAEEYVIQILKGNIVDGKKIYDDETFFKVLQRKMKNDFYRKMYVK